MNIYTLKATEFIFSLKLLLLQAFSLRFGSGGKNKDERRGGGATDAWGMFFNLEKGSSISARWRKLKTNKGSLRHQDGRPEADKPTQQLPLNN